MEKKEVFNRDLYNEFINLIDILEKKVNNPDKHKVYLLTRQLINYTFSKICEMDNNIDNLSIVSNLSKYLDRETKRKIFVFFEYLDKIDYGKFELDNEIIISVLEKFREILKLIFLRIKEYDYSHSKYFKNLKNIKHRILFISNVEKFKKNKKYDIDLIIKINEHYHHMLKKDRDKYELPYNYYAIQLPKLYELIERLKNASLPEEKHKILIHLNKLYFKLKEVHKKELSEKLKEIVNSDEEKLNVYLMLGYNLIHEKDIENLKKIRSGIDKTFEDLNIDLKKYYIKIVERFNSHANKLILKN